MEIVRQAGRQAGRQAIRNIFETPKNSNAKQYH
jgi:hypothetical protein